MYVYKCYQSLQIWLNSTCASRSNWSGESALLTKVINSLFCSLIVTLMCSIHPTVLFLYPLKLFLMFSWAIKKDLRWTKGLIRVVAVLSKSRMTIMNLKEASLIIFYLYLMLLWTIKMTSAISWKGYSREVSNYQMCCSYQENIYLFEFNNNRNTSKTYEICSKVTLKIPERRQLRRSSAFNANLKHIWQLFLMFLFSTLSL